MKTVDLCLKVDVQELALNTYETKGKPVIEALLNDFAYNIIQATVITVVSSMKFKHVPTETELIASVTEAIAALRVNENEEMTNYFKTYTVSIFEDIMKQVEARVEQKFSDPELH